MIDRENLQKEGFLWFPPHGVLGQLKKSWHKKYCQLFRSSKNGVDRLEVFDSEDEIGRISSNVIITLENCIKITQDAPKHQANVFAVITKSNINYFSANSENEMHDWISAFQAVAFRDNVSRQTIEEDNDLYCSSGDAGVFNVKLVSSEASNRCGLSAGYYTLLATPVALHLLDSDDQKTLYKWPYRYIRRYGHRSGRFTFEAGRKCESGEGLFHFEHSKELFRCIASRMKSMKKLLNQESHSLFCGDNQFQAALSMMARSRSPLPPSPTSATPLPDDVSGCGSLSSLKPLMPYFSNGSGNTSPHFVANVSPPPLMPKYTAAEPPPLKSPIDKLPQPSPPPLVAPRRSIPSPATETSPQHEIVVDFATVNGFDAAIPPVEAPSGPMPAYDDVEVRSEAWRTMGVDVVNHPFLFKIIPQQTILPAQTAPVHKATVCLSSVAAAEKCESQKIFHAPAANGATGNYDRLQHIGPVAKQSTAPGYKQIPLVSTSVSNSRLEEPIFTWRRPDDFKGYGMIRKKTSVDVSTDDVTKQLCEDLRYTVIHKPERV